MQTRTILREYVFTRFPHIAYKYYVKNWAFTKERKERRLRQIISSAIPVEGWKNEFPELNIITGGLEGSIEKPTALTTSQKSNRGNLVSDFLPAAMTTLAISDEPDLGLDTPLYLDPLPRSPPFKHVPRPPPTKMSVEAKLLCLAPWTLFNPSTGNHTSLLLRVRRTLTWHGLIQCMQAPQLRP